MNATLPLAMPARRRAHAELMWRDHGFIRLVFHNFHWIGPGVARANQPSPERLAHYAAMGFTTIVNLRGTSERGQYVLEREATDALGLTLIDLPMTATEAPTRDQILAVCSLFQALHGPALIHCKSGSDRTGLAGVLYRHLRRGEPIRLAMEQLSPKYLHLRCGRAGIVDFFFATYLAETQASGKGFIDWVTTDYDPVRLTAAYRPRRWIAGLGDLVRNLIDRAAAPAAIPA